MDEKWAETNLEWPRTLIDGLSSHLDRLHLRAGCVHV